MSFNDRTENRLLSLRKTLDELDFLNESKIISRHSKLSRNFYLSFRLESKSGSKGGCHGTYYLQGDSQT